MWEVERSWESGIRIGVSLGVVWYCISGMKGRGVAGVRKTGLTYAALSIHLHCVQNWMVTRGRTGSILGWSFIAPGGREESDRRFYLIFVFEKKHESGDADAMTPDIELFTKA